MPERKIILTLTNDDTCPDNVQIHIAAEQQTTTITSEAQIILYDTTLELTERIIQILQEDSRECEKY